MEMEKLFELSWWPCWNGSLGITYGRVYGHQDSTTELQISELEEISMDHLIQFKHLE